MLNLSNLFRKPPSIVEAQSMHQVKSISPSSSVSLPTSKQTNTENGTQNGMNLLKNRFSRLEKIWTRLGPGLVTGASDDDPSGITTYSQAGAQYGFGMMWTALLSFPLMVSIQEMCGRIGLVTNKGIAGVLNKHYPKYIIYPVALLTVPASIINIGADLAGMGAVANMVMPAVSVQVFTVLSALLIIAGIVFFSYKQLESVLKWLAAILLVYLVVPFLVKQNLGEVLTGVLIPHIQFNKEYMSLLVAILGTTISPYLFFWEASMEVEDHEQKLREANENPELAHPFEADIKSMQQDNFVGMFFSNLVMFFIIFTAGSTLFKNGISDIQTVEQAAAALKPIAGDGAYILFALGVIGTGFLAIPVLAGACSYIIAETLNWKEGMNLKLKEAKGFYLIIIISVLCGLLINFIGISPVQALIWTSIIYGLVSPILIAVILHICNNKAIMGSFTNSKLSNFLGFSCLIAMSICAVALLYFLV